MSLAYWGIVVGLLVLCALFLTTITFMYRHPASRGEGHDAPTAGMPTHSRRAA